MVLPVHPETLRMRAAAGDGRFFGSEVGSVMGSVVIFMARLGAGRTGRVPHLFFEELMKQSKILGVALAWLCAAGFLFGAGEARAQEPQPTTDRRQHRRPV